MELGQRLRQARLEAGLSQRQLCGETITRNMLSQIENGTAKPSMATLGILAQRLGKPISFFLEEEAVTSPNQSVMDRARRAFAAGEHDRTLGELSNYQGPDPVFDQEMALLRVLASLRLAEKAVEEQRLPYALELLERAAQAGAQTAYYGPELERKRLTLLAGVDPQAAEQLMPEDDVLLIRARYALAQGDYLRSAQYLDAAEGREHPRWYFLRGECHFGLQAYAAAAQCYHRAEQAYPAQTIPKLEQCYKELGDYKLAYEYACRQRPV